MAGTQKQQIDILEAQVAALTERITLIEAAVDTEADPPARSLKPDTPALIVEYLTKHPGSTAGDIAKGLDINRSTVSSSLVRLIKRAEAHKAKRGGYAAGAAPKG